uniref:TFIIB-type domain-containing protein n=1 Tax=Eutreptiella gymnastica TaxID=73025 RepID=A0A7S4GCF4_9EUGL
MTSWACPRCGGTEPKEDEGKLVCTTCGLVFQQEPQIVSYYEFDSNAGRQSKNAYMRKVTSSSKSKEEYMEQKKERALAHCDRLCREVFAPIFNNPHGPTPNCDGIMSKIVDNLKDVVGENKMWGREAFVDSAIGACIYIECCRRSLPISWDDIVRPMPCVDKRKQKSACSKRYNTMVEKGRFQVNRNPLSVPTLLKAKLCEEPLVSRFPPAHYQFLQEWTLALYAVQEQMSRLSLGRKPQALAAGIMCIAIKAAADKVAPSNAPRRQRDVIQATEFEQMGKVFGACKGTVRERVNELREMLFQIGKSTLPQAAGRLHKLADIDAYLGFMMDHLRTLLTLHQQTEQARSGLKRAHQSGTDCDPESKRHKADVAPPGPIASTGQGVMSHAAEAAVQSAPEAPSLSSSPLAATASHPRHAPPPFIPRAHPIPRVGCALPERGPPCWRRLQESQCHLSQAIDAAQADMAEEQRTAVSGPVSKEQLFLQRLLRMGMSKEDILDRSWRSKLVPPTYDASDYSSSHEAFKPLSDQERTEFLRPGYDVQWMQELPEYNRPEKKAPALPPRINTQKLQYADTGLDVFAEALADCNQVDNTEAEQVDVFAEALADCNQVDNTKAEQVDATDIKEELATFVREDDPSVTRAEPAERLAGSSSTKGNERWDENVKEEELKLENILRGFGKTEVAEFGVEDLLRADSSLEDTVGQPHAEGIEAVECCKEETAEFAGGYDEGIEAVECCEEETVEFAGGYAVRDGENCGDFAGGYVVRDGEHCVPEPHEVPFEAVDRRAQRILEPEVEAQELEALLMRPLT